MKNGKRTILVHEVFQVQLSVWVLIGPHSLSALMVMGVVVAEGGGDCSGRW
jgi:hypothetical protein